MKSICCKSRFTFDTEKQFRTYWTDTIGVLARWVVMHTQKKNDFLYSTKNGCKHTFMPPGMLGQTINERMKLGFFQPT